MKAIVATRPGGPEVLVIEDRVIPRAVPGQVVIRVKAFGLNRAEMFTRQGLSPGVEFPRVLGIECAGIVEDCPGGELAKGQTVVTAMGGMGRQFDGSYAEYTCVPVANAIALHTDLDWPILGAMPEMLQTAWGSLEHGLEVESGHSLLVRGGTSSIGLTAIALAKRRGAEVVATTRSLERESLLLGQGADHVIIDVGKIQSLVRSIFERGVDRVLELVGTTTLLDSMACARPKGIVCMTGIVGGRWYFDRFEPMVDIPHTVRLTAYSGGPAELRQTPLQQFADELAAGRLRIPVARTLSMHDVPSAHELMERGGAGGKMVVVVD